MTTKPPTLLWLRRDLRLADHPAWAHALSGDGGPVIPVFILDDVIAAQTGAAALWRLGLSLDDLGARLAERGSRLILRRGPALDVLRELADETGARRVVWSRLYDGPSRDRDTAIKAALPEAGIEAVSTGGHLLFEPWTVETKTGGLYKVYTPYWKAVRGLDVADPLPEPADLKPPAAWPASDVLSDWNLGRAMQRGAAVVARHAAPGEERARARLDAFIDGPIATYQGDRDRTDRMGTSRLSEHLTYGEISPRTAWAAGRAALERLPGPQQGQAETFLKELVWREFAYHLLFHSPGMETGNWRPEWDAFPWRGDSNDAERWRQGRTGIEMVDAAMRELYVSGYMHNRTRMLTASFLTKHLLTDWRIGEAWFRDCLIDWDPAANAMGWQWTAGSGPDAAPFFRVYNPDTQAEKFDPNGLYRRRWLAEGTRDPHADALSYYDAVPRAWGLSPDDAPPAPVISLAAGRTRALDAYQKLRKAA